MGITLDIDGTRAALAADTTLFRAAESAGCRPPSSCDAHGKCRECVVEIRRGAALLQSRTPAEDHLPADYRLACQARAKGEPGTIEVHLPGHGPMRIAGEGHNLPALPATTPLDPAVHRESGRILLDDTVVATDQGPLLGAALDLGTTTMVLRVYDLETGKLAASASLENPQRFAGSDVMARISWDTRHGGRLLQRVVVRSLETALRALSLDTSRIFELVVAGNTTMRDLFLGLDVEPVGQKPYRSTTETALREGRAATTALPFPARRLGLPLHASARVWALPLIGSHVGADTAAALLALDLDRSDARLALLDIGTNTEVVCGDRHGLHVASCPAGPAFEGGGVRCGMPGWDGAIERVRLDALGRPDISVIGGGAPRGLCGSALVDTLSELLRVGRMDTYGRLADGASRFHLTPEPADGVFLDEADISVLAQAKGANAAGLTILLAQQGLGFGDIERLYVAGGFGRHLDLAAARRIGLIPDLPDERLVTAGNAAIEGASIALLSRARRDDLDRYVRRAVHVELETDPGFFDHFVEGCLFKPFPPRA